MLPTDSELATWLRGSAPKRLVLAANKCERRGNDGSSGVEDMLAEATRLGLGEPVAISAETGDCHYPYFPEGVWVFLRCTFPIHYT